METLWLHLVCQWYLEHTKYPHVKIAFNGNRVRYPLQTRNFIQIICVLFTVAKKAPRSKTYIDPKWHFSSIDYHPQNDNYDLQYYNRLCSSCIQERNSNLQLYSERASRVTQFCAEMPFTNTLQYGYIVRSTIAGSRKVEMKFPMSRFRYGSFEHTASCFFFFFQYTNCTYATLF